MSDIRYPPGPHARNPIASVLPFRRDILKFMCNLAHYGDISYFRIYRFHLYLFNHPDLIQDVLVTNQKKFQKSRGLQMARVLLGNGLLTSEGEFHLRQRRMIQPAFHRQRLVNYAATMVEYADRTSRRWQPRQTVDMSKEMMRMTLAIAGKTLFNADVEAEADEIGASLTEVMHLFERTSSPISGLLDRLPLPSNRRFARAIARLDDTIYRMIAEHRAAGDQGDLLSMLLSSTDDDGGGGMSDRQVRDEAMTIFLAGHETTAIALSWTWYLLAQHPEVAQELHEELDRVLAGRLPVYDDVPNLIYTRMVFSEAMRLYPPAYVIGREAKEDYEAGGYTIKKGSTILMSQYVMHRDSRFYPDPERFDPCRWTPEAESTRPKFAYFPFGGGARLCIGESFAWTEGILALATLAQHCQPRLATSRPVELQPVITLRPRGGIPVIVDDRQPGD